MKRISVIVILVVCAAIGGACARARQPVVAPTPPALADGPPEPSSPPPSTSEPPTIAVLTDEETFALKSLDALNAERPLGDVFFDYDSASLRTADLDALQANAQWLNRWTSTRITIDGHCDSRGTAEYNLALGGRRATAARSYLISLGVAADRVSAVSKGKEQPFCSEESDSCWQQNRRAHFIITAK
jgi:peptidoglycan-associated lipoprotein